jgi:hypothetical protein
MEFKLAAELFPMFQIEKLAENDRNRTGSQLRSGVDSDQ